VRKLGQLAGDFRHQSDSSGNLSVRIGDRIFVTTSGCYINDLRETDFVEITGFDYTDHVLRCIGQAAPSSEAYMHYLIYQRTDCRAIVHVHSIPKEKEIRSMQMVTTPPMEGGSIALAEAVAAACSHCDIVYIQRHGLVFRSLTIENCQAILRHALTLLH